MNGYMAILMQRDTKREKDEQREKRRETKIEKDIERRSQKSVESICQASMSLL